MNNMLTIIPEKIEFIYPTNIDKLAIIVIMLAIPSIVGVIWKAFDKNRSARGDAPNIFIMFIVITLIYLFTYRNLSMQNEIAIMEVAPKKEFVIMDKKKYEQELKENGQIDFLKKYPRSYDKWVRKINLNENLDLKMGYVGRLYLTEEEAKKESDILKSWKIYYDIPMGNSYIRRVVLDEGLYGIPGMSDKITEENMRSIYEKLKS